MRIKNVIFDLDGTLLDTTEGVVESVKYTAQKLGYPKLPYEKLLRFIGPPIQQSFMAYYGADGETAQKAADIFRTYYKTEALLKAVPYDGIYELCDILKSNRISMAVATYKREDYALTLLKHYRFDVYCTVMHGADHHNILKKEDIVNICIEEMDGTKETTVLIGDTSNDAVGAAKAGISFAAVTYGFGFRNLEEVNMYNNIGAAAAPLQMADIILRNGY